MRIKALGVIFVILVVILLGVYYFMPFKELEFEVHQGNYNFSINESSLDNMQFYPNMRYPSKYISYKISNCSIKKKEDMRDAFDILENITILDFYPISSDEDISVTCDERARFEKNMFVAGEGGPRKIVKSGDYNVILSGMVLLIRDSSCKRPNIAIHELLHALGFKHSENPNNIMYNYTSCKQTIGEDIPALLDELYLIPSSPDLTFEGVSANMHGRYLDMNMTVRNVGLGESREAKIYIKMGESVLKEVELIELEIGGGRMISLSNLWVSKINIDEIILEINYDFDELDKENNNISLKIKG